MTLTWGAEYFLVFVNSAMSFLRMSERPKTFGGNTRDLGSILEETGQEYDFTPKECLKNKSQMVKTASGKLATPSGSASDCVMKIVTTGPHDTQYCMENPDQAFVNYASLRTDKTGGLVSNFMASQDAKITRFEADLKQHQSEITNKLDTILKAFNDRMTRALSSDTIKNPKLNPNSTSSARSYPTGDPQCSSNSLKSVNANVFQSTTNIQKNQLQVNTLKVNEIETPKPKEPKESLKDEFINLHLYFPVLEVLAYVPIYDALLNKYIVSLELGKNGSEFIQSITPRIPLFILPCRLGDSKPFDTLADLGSCVNLIPLNLFKKLNIGLLEEAKDALGLADGTKSYP
ncbi:hypothetical protein Tco_0509676 [Tanacetum coccineum]